MRNKIVASGLVAATLLAGVAALAAGGSAQAVQSPFYVDPDTSAAKLAAANPGDHRAPIIRDRLAATPQGRWFTTTNTSTVRGEVDAYVSAAAAAGTIPIMVAYDIPNRDCGGPAAVVPRRTRPTGRGPTRWRPGSPVVPRPSCWSRTCSR